MNGLGHNTAAGKQLRSFIERIEYMNEEISKAQSGRQEIFLEAKNLGFCAKTMKEIVRLRRMSESERQEAEALLDIYLGAMGMLGTPLGDYARQRLSGTPQHETVNAETGEITEKVDEPPVDAPEEPSPPRDTVDEAREKGRQSARNGMTVIENPYPAGDVNRAAWDEGWCEEQGSDGMGIPAAWRRSKPKSVDEDKTDNTNHGPGGDQ
jgi:uncharacterized protein (UPF0335 family)